jgi:hypothetical protein
MGPLLDDNLEELALIPRRLPLARLPAVPAHVCRRLPGDRIREVSVRSSAPMAGGVRSPASLDGGRTSLDA